MDMDPRRFANAIWAIFWINPNFIRRWVPSIGNGSNKSKANSRKFSGLDSTVIRQPKIIMTTKFFRPHLLAAFAASLAFSTSLRAAIAPAENLLPADTLAFFTVPDCTALHAVSKVSPQMMFWNDAAMKPFHDKFMAKLNEKFTAPLEHELVVKWLH